MTTETALVEKYGETLFALDAPERNRLTLLGEVFDPLSTATLTRLGVGRSARCLEVGAGTGSIARWLASQVPGGEVVATDLNEALLARLTGPNLVPLRHDVTVDPFPESSFDVIHARFVLSHLPGRLDVLRRMSSWLRPGGFLMFESFSWFPIDSSPHPAYRHAMQRWSELILSTIGTDSRWSRALPTVLAEYGLADVGAETFTRHMRGGGPLAEFWWQTLRMSRRQLIDGGYLTTQQVLDVQRLLRDPGFWDLAPAVTQAWGRR
ncbi:class I SAM-dependent methyltransferase [Spirillospora sp. NPDC047279]|uniref:class I SAM-dependent methyltransferase n=1 Tax=Spirillospora sp. NPDC047279 TaxID=3155478 RepID=UPI0033E5ED47